MVEIPVMLLWLLGTLVFSVGIAVGFLIERQCHVPWKSDTLEILAENARRMAMDIAELREALHVAMAMDIAELREALHVAKGEDEEAK